MNKIKIAKLLDAEHLPDSAKASHILIGLADPTKEADWAVAKNRTDSIKDIVNKENFAEMAKEVLYGPWLKHKGGDMGWFKQG